MAIPTVSKCSYVYALCEPNQGFAPRYVGVTTNPEQRFRSHLRKSNSLDVRRWISAGAKPRMAILETLPNCYIGCALRAERWWILHLLGQGHVLFNRAGTRDTEAEVRAMWIRRIAAQRIRKLFRVPQNRPLGGAPNLKHLAYGGRSLTMSMWARELGISRQRLHQRLSQYPIHVALTTARGETPEKTKRALQEAKQERIARRAAQAESIRAERAASKARVGKSRIVQMSHAERRLRRREIASAVLGGESVEAAAERFGVTTVTVRTALNELACTEARS